VHLPRIFRREKGQFNIPAIVGTVVILLIVVAMLPLLNLTTNVNIPSAINILEGNGYAVAAPGEGWAASFWPTVDDTYDLGTNTYNWQDFYLSGTLYGEVGRGETFTVAASDASAKSIAQADYICDGLNDQVQIQAAIDALPSTIYLDASGGSISLSEGAFHLSAGLTISQKSVCIKGQGWQTTQLRMADNADADMITVSGADATHRGKLQLYSVRLNGNKGNQSSGKGLVFGSYVKDIILQNIIIESCKEHAIEFTTDAGVADISIIGCAIENNGRGAVIQALYNVFISNKFIIQFLF